MGTGHHSTSEGSYGIWLLTLSTLATLTTLAAASKNFDYEWRTGPWSSCQHDVCGFGGTRSRTVWCSHKSGWTTLRSHCHYLPSPPDTQQCFKVCEEQRSEVTWVPSQWSECQTGGEQCTRLGGTQNRQVPCVHLPTQTVMEDAICEYFRPKPPPQRKCELRCPQDCVLSAFSGWSDCEECFHLHSRRVRKVLVAPLNGGRPCPPLVESRLCNNCTDTYRFQVGKWSPCHKTFQFKNPKKKERSHMLIGYQNRDILCVNSEGKTVGHRYCLDSLHLPGLRNMQSCTMPQHCQVSDWMEWHSVNNSCLSQSGTIIPGYMTRIRRVRQMPHGTGKSCPPLIDTFQVIGAASTIPSCPRYDWVTSHWSDCEMLHQSLKRAEQCGPGIHTRLAYCVQLQARHHEMVDCSQCFSSVVCHPSVNNSCVTYSSKTTAQIFIKVDGKEIVVDSSLCQTSRPSLTRPCRVSCTQNCTVSHWSEWSVCGPDSCSSTQRQASFRFRNRTVLQPQGGFGLPCPYLSESQSCMPAPCVTWNIATIQACQPRPGATCGPGTQNVSVTCQDRNGKTVPDDKCLIHTRIHKQSSVSSCYLACPEDCILADWSVWSLCPQDCDRKGAQIVRRRSRLIYAKAGQGGMSCPTEEKLSEEEVCPMPPACQTYMWQTSDWGSCVIIKRSVTCGSGVRSRSVQCYRTNGVVMPDGRCSSAAKPVESEVCSVPCPVDCHVTEWSGWTACSATCQAVGSSAYPLSKQIRRRYVLEESSGGGKPCPTHLTEARPCGPLPFCTYYKWAVSDWSLCVLPPYYIYCGQGLKARTVTCQDEGGNETYPDFCLRSVGPMPAATATCFVMCDQDCKLSSWSAFGQCVNGCDGFRIRTRNLLDDSKSKDVCRDQMKYPLVDKAVCRCADYKPVLIGDWTACILEDTVSDEVSMVTDGEGGKGRKYSKSFAPAEKQNVIGAEDFLEGFSMFELTTSGSVEKNLLEPESVREAGRKRPEEGRKVHVMSIPEGQSLADVPGRPTVARRRQCGMGTKYQLYICQSQIQPGVLEPASNCSAQVYSEEVCIVPCPADCEMTGWSQWSPCSVSCGYGIQTRQRHILKHGQHGGRICPPMTNGREVENQTCHSICSTNTWRTSAWSQCFAQGSTGLNREMLCGIGFKTRLVDYELLKPNDCGCEYDQEDLIPASSWKTLESHWSVFCACMKGTGQTCPCKRCVKKADFYWALKDSEFFCRSEPRPIGRELCEMPCPGKCVVDDWSSWSECPQPCSQLNFRKRSRRILRKPKDENDYCPPLTEEVSCIKEHNCFEFNWEISDWSSCILEDKSNDCGIGWRKRYAFCQSANGTLVDWKKCEELYGPMRVRSVETCNKMCDVNCAMSEWSPWSGCSRTCGLGMLTRKRSVLFAASGRGRQCPEELAQTKPCFAQACYSIVLSEWTTCQLKKGSCGHGIENRHMLCLSEDGLPVDIDRCANQAVNLSTIQIERPCSVPCPGECQLLEWSEWSACYISCQDFHQDDRTGLQTRSRAILLSPTLSRLSCPPTWESRPCGANQCFSFLWRFSDWSGGGRNVWCSRSDGVNVTGGCEELSRPPDKLRCSPGCSANHSWCVDTDLCGCHPPYTPIYDSDSPTPQLIKCAMGPNGTHPSSAPALYYPLDGPTNFWMYAVLAAGILFIIFVIVALYTIWRRDQKDKSSHEPSMASASCPKTTKALKSQAGRSMEGNDKAQSERGNGVLLINSRSDSGEVCMGEDVAGDVEQNPAYAVLNNPSHHEEEQKPLFKSAKSDANSAEDPLPSAGPENQSVLGNTPAEEPSESTALLDNIPTALATDTEETLQVITADIHVESDTNKTPDNQSTKPTVMVKRQPETSAGKAFADIKFVNKLSSQKEEKYKVSSPTNRKLHKDSLSSKNALNKGNISNMKSEKVSSPTKTKDRVTFKPTSGSVATDSLPANSNLGMGTSPSNTDAAYGKLNLALNRPPKEVRSANVLADSLSTPTTIKVNKPGEFVSDKPTQSKAATDPIILSKTPMLSKAGLMPRHSGGFSENGHSLQTTSACAGTGLVQNVTGLMNTEAVKQAALVNEGASNPCVVIEQDLLDSDSDLPDSTASSLTKLPLMDSREHLAEIITTV